MYRDDKDETRFQKKKIQRLVVKYTAREEGPKSHLVDTWDWFLHSESVLPSTKDVSIGCSIHFSKHASKLFSVIIYGKFME